MRTDLTAHSSTNENCDPVLIGRCGTHISTFPLHTRLCLDRLLTNRTLWRWNTAMFVVNGWRQKTNVVKPFDVNNYTELQEAKLSRG